MTDKEKIDMLRAALLVLLDQIDYTSGACGATELVGGALSTDVIERSKLALEETK